VDAINVYVTTANYMNMGGAVLKVPLAGGSITPLSTSVQTPAGIVAKGSDVYFVNQYNLSEVPATGGTTQGFGSFGGTLIAADATSIYWASTSSIGKLTVGSGTTTTPVSSQSTIGGIASDGTSIYWTTMMSAGQVMKMPAGGGPPTTLASGQSSPSLISVDGVNAYWVAGTAIMTTPVGGGTPTTLAPVKIPVGIAVDSMNVYWADRNNLVTGLVNSVPIGGGAAKTIAVTAWALEGIAVDAVSINWIDNDSGGGEIWRLAK
jgi:hypothetical protein